MSNIKKTLSEKNKKTRLWLARVLIAVVVFLNLQAAALFLINPAEYAPGFELTGVPGSAMIQALGLLFIMWNIPYIVAMIHPVRWRLSLLEAMGMQFIGLAGETFLWQLLPANHPVIAASATRFILFDAGDLGLLLLAWFFTQPLVPKKSAI